MIVTNIQRFCVNDGPGIRTTVFFKGCSIRCPWCANPENILPNKQYYFKKDKCLGNNCRLNSNCDVLDNINKVYGERNFEKYKCLLNAIDIYGKEYNVESLIEEILKDKIFWKTTGGVTFSGGEPLLQGNEFVETLEKLKNNKVNIVIETSLFANESILKKVIPYVDMFYVDIKILDKDECKTILGGDISQFYSNLNLLKKSKGKIIFRIPCSKEYTFTKENIELIKKLLMNYNDYEVEIFQIHELAESKYQSLGKEVFRTEKINKEELEKFIDWCNDNKISAKIINI